MANSIYAQLISLRIDRDTLKKIDEYCEKRPYLSRSYAINRVLKKIFVKSPSGIAWKLIETPDTVELCGTKS